MVSLSADLQDSIRSRVDSGPYRSEEEVVRAALEALAEREKAADIASIQRGLADLEAGRCLPAEESEANCRERFGLDGVL